METDPTQQYQVLVNNLCQSLNEENGKMIRYLCKEFIPHSKEFVNLADMFGFFESKCLISLTDLTFVGEILYHIKRYDLLKTLPGVKSRKDYEENFLLSETSNFSPFRITCLLLALELSFSDFQVLKNFCRKPLTPRNYEKSNDIYILLNCLEEQDIFSDGDLEFMLISLRHLDNQIPFQMFQCLSIGDFSYVYPSNRQRQVSQNVPRQPRTVHSSLHLNEQPSLYSHFKAHSLPSEKCNDILAPSNIIIGQAPQHFLMHDIDVNNSNKAFSEPDPNPIKNRNNNGAFVATAPHRVLDDVEKDDTTPLKDPVTANNHIERDLRCNPVLGEVPSFESGPHWRVLHSVEHSDHQTEYYESPDESELINNENFVPVDNSNSFSLKRIGCYEINSNPAGICLIINNMHFERSLNIPEAKRRLQLQGHDYPVPNVGLKDRIGSEIDVEKTQRLFKDFGFRVLLHENLDSRAMQNVLQSMARKNHSNYDCFVLIVMTHGALGSVYGVDGMPVRNADIRSYFKPDKCPSLLDKPKIFFIQACQGERSMDGHAANPVDDIEADGPSETPSSATTTPSEADFLFCFSTVPGYISYRSRSSGSFFINLVVDNLERYHEREDLLSILANVNAELARESRNQTSMPVSTLRKKLFFKKATSR